MLLLFAFALAIALSGCKKEKQIFYSQCPAFTSFEVSSAVCKVWGTVAVEKGDFLCDRFEMAEIPSPQNCEKLLQRILEIDVPECKDVLVRTGKKVVVKGKKFYKKPVFIKAKVVEISDAKVSAGQNPFFLRIVADVIRLGNSTVHGILTARHIVAENSRITGGVFALNLTSNSLKLRIDRMTSIKKILVSKKVVLRVGETRKIDFVILNGEGERICGKFERFEGKCIGMDEDANLQAKCPDVRYISLRIANLSRKVKVFAVGREVRFDNLFLNVLPIPNTTGKITVKKLEIETCDEDEYFPCDDVEDFCCGARRVKLSFKLTPENFKTITRTPSGLYIVSSKTHDGKLEARFGPGGLEIRSRKPESQDMFFAVVPSENSLSIPPHLPFKASFDVEGERQKFILTVCIGDFCPSFVKSSEGVLVFAKIIEDFEKVKNSYLEGRSDKIYVIFPSDEVSIIFMPYQLWAVVPVQNQIALFDFPKLKLSLLSK